MGDGSLSQDEIDALLQGADDMMAPVETAPAMDFKQSSGAVSPAEQNAIRDILNTTISAVAPSLSGYLGGKALTIGNPVVEVKPQDAIRGDFPAKYVQVSMDYSGAISGKNLIVFNMKDAGVISSLMMGDDPPAAPAELNDAYLNTLQEFTNQLLSSLATQFSNKLGGGINTTPATVSVVNSSAELQLPPGESVKVSYDIIIEGILSSRLFHIIDLGISQGLSRGSAPAFSSQQQPQQQYQQAGQVGISPVKFPPLDEGISSGMVGDISLLLDVPMTLTVELGRTTRLVQEILGLGEGSIIELDKLAGEPVDLLVNGKLIAKGEVVVIDENFGVRVTDIVSPDDRLMSLRQE